MPDRQKLEAQFNRANISSKDFSEAEGYLNAYRNDLTETVRRALLVSAVIAYARPFTSNNGGSKGLATRTLAGNPKSILCSEEFTLHETILRLRNEAIAHSDYDRRPTRFAQSIGTGFLTWSKPFDVLSETISIPTFLEICKKMKSHCVSRMFSLNRDLGTQE